MVFKTFLTPAYLLGAGYLLTFLLLKFLDFQSCGLSMELYGKFHSGIF